MHTKKDEVDFRHYIEPRMRTHWKMTWHEDRCISPGVPDLHYCFLPEGTTKYRIGWLELKASRVSLSKRNRIAVEPSQHQYYRRWLPMMPIHFLVRVETTIYLIPGELHDEIPYVDSENIFPSMSVCWFRQIDIASVLPEQLKSIVRI